MSSNKPRRPATLTAALHEHLPQVPPATPAGRPLPPGEWARLTALCPSLYLAAAGRGIGRPGAARRGTPQLLGESPTDQVSAVIASLIDQYDATGCWPADIEAYARACLRHDTADRFKRWNRCGRRAEVPLANMAADDAQSLLDASPAGSAPPDDEIAAAEAAEAVRQEMTARLTAEQHAALRQQFWDGTSPAVLPGRTAKATEHLRADGRAALRASPRLRRLAAGPELDARP